LIASTVNRCIDEKLDLVRNGMVDERFALLSLDDGCRGFDTGVLICDLVFEIWLTNSD
jgi:hypothetical protein